MNYAVAPEQCMDDVLLTVSVFSRYRQTSTLVALCLYCLWTSAILSEIHCLSRRKAASQRPAKTAGPPRRLTTEGPLALRRRVQEECTPRFQKDILMTDSLMRFPLQMAKFRTKSRTAFLPQFSFLKHSPESYSA
jgi:hypothetical protein